VSQVSTFTKSSKSHVGLEALEDRLALTAAFMLPGGVLQIYGDNNANHIQVTDDANGRIHVFDTTNGVRHELVVHSVDGAIATPRISNTHLIQAFGFGGNDQLFADVTRFRGGVYLYGGAGNDTL